MTSPRSCVNCAHHVHVEGIFINKHLCYQPNVLEELSPIEGQGVICAKARSKDDHRICWNGNKFQPMPKVEPPAAKSPPHPDELVCSACGKSSPATLFKGQWFSSCHGTPMKAQDE